MDRINDLENKINEERCKKKLEILFLGLFSSVDFDGFKQIKKKFPTKDKMVVEFYYHYCLINVELTITPHYLDEDMFSLSIGFHKILDSNILYSDNSSLKLEISNFYKVSEHTKAYGLIEDFFDVIDSRYGYGE